LLTNLASGAKPERCRIERLLPGSDGVNKHSRAEKPMEVRLGPNITPQLEYLSGVQGRSVHALVNEILEGWLKENYSEAIRDAEARHDTSAGNLYMRNRF
jgi:predicted DNA-binding protein